MRNKKTEHTHKKNSEGIQKKFGRNLPPCVFLYCSANTATHPGCPPYRNEKQSGRPEKKKNQTVPCPKATTRCSTSVVSSALNVLLAIENVAQRDANTKKPRNTQRHFECVPHKLSPRDLLAKPPLGVTRASRPSYRLCGVLHDVQLPLQRAFVAQFPAESGPAPTSSTDVMGGSCCAAQSNVSRGDVNTAAAGSPRCCIGVKARQLRNF